jgi:hypothetical protein
MNNNHCPDCAHRDTIIRQQEKRIAQLERIIQQALLTASTIQANAGQILNTTGQPRGRWAFAKGADQAAQVIGSRLEG